jgi:hypothetical protein
MLVGVAQAANQNVLGNAIVIKDPQAAAAPNPKQKITVKAKDTGETIVGDPVANGATLRITTSGDNPTTQSFTMDKNCWSGSVLSGKLKYKSDGSALCGPVKAALIRLTPTKFTFKAILANKTDGGGIVIIPPGGSTPGSCVLLTLGGGDSYSVKFTPGDGITTSKDGILYKQRKVANKGTCTTTTTTTTVTLPTTTSTTTTTTTTTSTTTTTLYGSPSRAFVDRVLGILD